MTTASPPFAGRTALVTGAAGDIGRAVAVRLAAHGAGVVVADLGTASAALDETASRCEAAGSGEVLVRCFDVSVDRDVDAAVADVVATAGVPDAVFNNAGIQGHLTNTSSYDLADARQVLEVNVIGVLSVMAACARALIAAARGGSIVNTASMAGVGGAPNMVAYSASKGAVIAMTKSAAKDLAGAGIRVNAISPGFVGPGAMWDRQVALQASEPSQYYADDAAAVEQQMITQVPLRRYGTLDEVAAVAQFLLSDESSYLTGVNIEISGGAA